MASAAWLRATRQGNRSISNTAGDRRQQSCGLLHPLRDGDGGLGYRHFAAHASASAVPELVPKPGPTAQSI